MAGVVGKLFCIGMVGIGLGIAGWHVETVGDGVRLMRSDLTAEARVTGKRIEQPHRSASVRVTEIEVNGVGVRSLRTYYRDHFLELRLAGDGEGEARDVLAPVGFERFRAEEVGGLIPVTILPDGGEYVDAAPRATLLYALKRIAIGGLIALVGLAALLLPDPD